MRNTDLATPIVRAHISRSPVETQLLAARLLPFLENRAALALHGNLGSGKTCFVQGLARALGITHAVSSPTFTYAHEYHGERPLYHLDLYRLNGEEDFLNLGLDEYLGLDGLTVIEWAENAGTLLPPATWHLDFTVLAEPDARSIRVYKQE